MSAGTSSPIQVFDANDEETAGNSMSFTGTLKLPAILDASALPTADPSVAGQVYSDSGVLTVSSG